MTAEEVLTVLILDDEDAVRESLCDHFEDHGFRPLSAHNGEAAMELLGVESPDAAIVDIRMVGMTGDEFIHQACTQQPGCAFVIYTGSPGYGIPDSLHTLERVSPIVFQKPVTDLGLLRREILRMVAWIRRRDSDSG